MAVTMVVHGAADHAHDTTLLVMLLSATGVVILMILMTTVVRTTTMMLGIIDADPADDCDGDDDRDVACGTDGDYARAGTKQCG